MRPAGPAGYLHGVGRSLELEDGFTRTSLGVGGSPTYVCPHGVGGSPDMHWQTQYMSNMPRNLELRNAKRFTNVLATALQLASGDTQSGADLLVRAPILPKIRYLFSAE